MADENQNIVDYERYKNEKLLDELIYISATLSSASFRDINPKDERRKISAIYKEVLRRMKDFQK